MISHYQLDKLRADVAAFAKSVDATLAHLQDRQRTINRTLAEAEPEGGTNTKPSG